MKILLLLSISILLSQEYYTDLPNNTGISQMIIFSSSISSLDQYDEVGIFDMNGLLSNQECTDEYGEILVGSGVWLNEQLNVTSIGALDLCDFNDGYQLPGFLSGNTIVVRVWDSSENIEYETTLTFSEGSSNFEETSFAVISDIFIEEALSTPELENSSFLLSSIYPNPFNSLITIEIDIITPSNTVEIDIYDIRGRHIDNIINSSSYVTGRTSIYWDANNVQSGIYIIKLRDESGFESKKVTLLK